MIAVDLSFSSIDLVATIATYFYYNTSKEEIEAAIAVNEICAAVFHVDDLLASVSAINTKPHFSVVPMNPDPSTLLIFLFAI